MTAAAYVTCPTPEAMPPPTCAIPCRPASTRWAMTTVSIRRSILATSGGSFTTALPFTRGTTPDPYSIISCPFRAASATGVRAARHVCDGRCVELRLGSHVRDGLRGQRLAPRQLGALHRPVHRAGVTERHFTQPGPHAAPADVRALKERLRPFNRRDDVHQRDLLGGAREPESAARAGERLEEPRFDQGLKLLVQVGLRQFVTGRKSRRRDGVSAVGPGEREQHVYGPLDALVHPHEPKKKKTRTKRDNKTTHTKTTTKKPAAA